MRTTGIILITAAALGATAAPAGAKTFKQADTGSSITVKAGDTFKVRLRQAFDGGYAWKVKKVSDASVVKLVDTKDVKATCDDNNRGLPCIGGFNWFVATFKAVGTGTASIRMVEKRSFENKVVQRWRIGVTVK